MRFPIKWGATTARERGPIIGTVSRPGDRNVIGSHGGSYALYRALAVSSGALDPIRRPDLTNTYPAATIGPFGQWSDPRTIVSLDPWGHLAADSFKTEIAEGIDIRPSIAITKARLDLNEICSKRSPWPPESRRRRGAQNGSVGVTKSPIDPGRYLPGIAERFNTPNQLCAARSVRQTAGMFPELVTRRTLQFSCRRSAQYDLHVRRRHQASRSHHQDHLSRA